jgi:hypothetical protein
VTQNRGVRRTAYCVRRGAVTQNREMVGLGLRTAYGVLRTAWGGDAKPGDVRLWDGCSGQGVSRVTQNPEMSGCGIRFVRQKQCFSCAVVSVLGIRFARLQERGGRARGRVPIRRDFARTNPIVWRLGALAASASAVCFAASMKTSPFLL